MILIEKTEVMGFDQAIRGMRNPMNSWDKSDSGICKGGDSGIGCINCAYAYISDGCNHSYDHSFQIGKNDYELMMKLIKGGPVHAKFRRMIAVYVDITAPLYWWKEFDTYKVGTVANSSPLFGDHHVSKIIREVMYMYNDKILCDDCQHRDVCSFKAEFIKAKKAVDEVYVERTVCDPNSFGMVKLSNIPWIHPVELKCKHHLLNIGKRGERGVL